MKKTFFLLFVPLMFLCTQIYAQKRTIAVPEPFIEKGTWLLGGSMSYHVGSTDNYDMLAGLLADLTGETSNFKVSPFAAFFVKDDLALGARFEYKKNKIVGGTSLLEETNLFYDDVSEEFYTKLFMRNYLRLGKTNRFAIFNETSVGYGYKQKQAIMTMDEETNGTFSTTQSLELGLTPGLVAFINEYSAIEVSLNVLGFSTEWETQEKNRVEEGTKRTGGADFKIDLLSINIGVSFFF